MESDDQQPVSSSGGGVRLDKGYIRTLPAILKIAEFVSSLIALICASSNLWWTPYGGGWVQFVTCAACATVAIIYLLYLLSLTEKLPKQWPFVEFIYHCVMTGMMMIAFIVASARSTLITPSGNTGIIASAVFLCIALIVFGIDTFLGFKNCRGSSSRSTTTTHSSAASYSY